MIGVVPAMLTYYCRMKMPETGRYITIKEGNTKQIAIDMTRVLDIEIQVEQDKVVEFNATNYYPLRSNEF